VLYDYLGEENKTHFQNVLGGLKSLDIDYEIDHNLVRGLDYYTSTTFEILSENLGAQNAVLGGGRYDMLVQQLGGKPTPAIGFACGLERLTLVLQANNYNFPDPKSPDLYLITSGEDAKKKALVLAYNLRMKNVYCETDLLGRSIKSQMKEANKLNARYVVVIGEDELAKNSAKIKKMEDGSEIETVLNDIVNYNFN
jgi:histidyl-tRNA synthetase